MRRTQLKAHLVVGALAAIATAFTLTRLAAADRIDHPPIDAVFGRSPSDDTASEREVDHGNAANVRSFLAGEGRPLVAFLRVTEPMLEDAFFHRDRCLAMTDVELPRVASDVNVLLDLAGQLPETSMSEQWIFDIRVKNAALIVCNSGREVGQPGRDALRDSSSDLDAKLRQIGITGSA